MIVLISILFLTIYLFVFFESIRKISRGNLEYILFYICIGLPFYATLQAQVFQIFENEIFVNLIKISKDLIFFYAFIIFILGNKISLSKRAFSFSLLDKLFLIFTFFILVYTLIPLGEADIFSKIIYAKNLLIIPITYCIGRNITLESRFFNKIIRIFFLLIITSSSLVFLEFLTSTHFHTLIEYSNYNSVVNEIDPQGNYGLSWSFESQESSPRYASFFADPLEFSASLILFFSFILYYFHTSFKKVHFIFLFLIFISLFLSFSRGSIIACLGLVLFSLLIHKKYKSLLSIFLSLILFLFLLYNFSSEEIQYIIIDTIKFENTSSLGHLIEWIEGILSILENPLGIGLAMSGNAGGVDQSLKVGGENQFLILGVQMGAIALLIYTLILFYVIIRAIKTFQNSKNHQKHISYVVACSKFGLLLPLLTANAELYLFVSLTTWFLAGNVESTYIKQLVEKKKSLY